MTSILNPLNMLNDLQLMIFNTIFKKDELGRYVDLVDTMNGNISLSGKKDDELDSNEYFMLSVLRETVAKFLLQFQTEKDIVKLLLDIKDSNLSYINYIKDFQTKNTKYK